ncbi:MAG: SsrA-binding protein SmpB [Planctomycetota bacterium]
MAKGNKNKKKDREPTIENRKARHLYTIEDTLEVGIRLTGTEVKSVRDTRVSIGEGFVTATTHPLRLTLHSVRIDPYDNASAAFQHKPVHDRELLAHKREIQKLADAVQAKGITIVPLKIYFKNNLIKLQIGVAKGKSRVDKRQDLREREHQREIDRAMSKKV